MANFMFNIARGRCAELFRRVDGNDPAASVLFWMIINTTSADSVLIDFDTVDALVGDANTAEVTNTNYAKKTITDTDLATTDYDPDDVADDLDLGKGLADQTWTAVGSGTAWTDAILCYVADGDTAPTNDANQIPLMCFDFIVTPSGNDITLQVSNTTGVSRHYSP